MIVAANWFSICTGGPCGITVSGDGATPNEHCKSALLSTGIAMPPSLDPARAPGQGYCWCTACIYFCKGRHAGGSWGMLGLEEHERRWPSVMLFVPALVLFAIAGGA